jgi:hypothetical protein
VRTVWVHSQEEHRETDTKPTTSDPQLPDPVSKDRVITALVPILEGSLAKTDMKRESERYSAFV